MNDEERMENTGKTVTKIEWAGLEYNPMLPHEIKKFIELRMASRTPKAPFVSVAKNLAPGTGIKVGPLGEPGKVDAAVRAAQNSLSKLKWPEGYNTGVYTDEEGKVWLAVVRGLKPKKAHSYTVILE